MGKNRNIAFETMAGGGVLATTAASRLPCECWLGKILLDSKTKERVGHEHFFFDSYEEAYFLDGKRLDISDFPKIDWSVPKYSIDPAYIREDGQIHGVIAVYEACDHCMHVKTEKAGGGTLRWAIPSPSGRRRYMFEFGPNASIFMKNKFVNLQTKFAPRMGKEQLEFLIFCLQFFREYSDVADCTERALARRFRITRGRVHSMKRRFFRRLQQSAVQK